MRILLRSRTSLVSSCLIVAACASEAPPNDVASATTTTPSNADGAQTSTPGAPNSNAPGGPTVPGPSGPGAPQPTPSTGAPQVTVTPPGVTQDPITGAPTGTPQPTDTQVVPTPVPGGTGGAGPAPVPVGTGGGVPVPAGGAPGVAGDSGTGGVPGMAGMGTGGSAGGAPNVPGGFQCPAEPGTPNLSATPMPIAGVPLADTFGQGFSILEGPVWTGDALYFSQIASDQSPNPSRIYRFVPGGTPEVWLATAFSNGLALTNDGALLAARHSDGSLTRIELASQAEVVVAANYMSSAFNSPNDIAVRSDGNLYFTDPDYQKPSDRQAIPTRIYRVDPSGTVSVVDGDKQQPNGVTLSLDESWLYASGQMPLSRYPVMADGSTGVGESLGNTGEMLRGSDGMGIDCGGRLYVTGNQAVTVVDTNSGTFEVLGSITFPDIQSVTNVAFGGANGTTLYVTSLGSTPRLFSVELGVVGRPY